MEVKIPTLSRKTDTDGAPIPPLVFLSTVFGETASIEELSTRAFIKRSELLR